MNIYAEDVNGLVVRTSDYWFEKTVTFTLWIILTCLYLSANMVSGENCQVSTVTSGHGSGVFNSVSSSGRENCAFNRLLSRAAGSDHENCVFNSTNDGNVNCSGRENCAFNSTLSRTAISGHENCVFNMPGSQKVPVAKWENAGWNKCDDIDAEALVRNEDESVVLINGDNSRIMTQGRVFIGTDRDGGNPSEEQLLMDEELAYDLGNGMVNSARVDDLDGTVSGMPNARIDGRPGRDFSKSGKLFQ